MSSLATPTLTLLDDGEFGKCVIFKDNFKAVALFFILAFVST
jgi:hypothetical protein